jgi:hypothetical protein
LSINLESVENILFTAESSELIDPKKPVMVDLVTPTGKVLQTSLPERGQGKSSNIFASTFTTPIQPFQFHVRGTNVFGESFERTIADVIRPLPFQLELTFLSNAGTITPGQSSYIHLSLYNKGPGGYFTINILETNVFNFDLSSKSFYVKRNKHEYFYVKVKVKNNQSVSEIVGHLYKLTIEAVARKSKNSTILTIDLVVLSGTVRSKSFYPRVIQAIVSHFRDLYGYVDMAPVTTEELALNEEMQ